MSNQKEKADSSNELQDLNIRLKRHETIHEVGGTLSDFETLKEAMQKVVNIVARGLGYTRTAILLLDPELEELELISAYGYGDVDGLRIPISKGATGYAVRHKEPVNIPDVTTDPRYVTGIYKGRSELAVPITVGDKVQGVLDVESTVMNAFGPEDIHLLKLVATYSSVAIGIAECREALVKERNLRKRMTLEADLLGSVNQKLAALENSAQVFDEIPKLANGILGLKNSVVWVVEPSSAELVAMHIHGSPGFEMGDHLSNGEGVPGLAIKQGRAIKRELSVSTGESDNIKENRYEMVVPLRNDTEIVGVLHIRRESEPFTSSELALLILFGSQITGVLTSLTLKRSTEKQIKKLDDRTRRLDLLNRVTRSLTKRLELDELLEELLHLCSEAFDLSHVAVLLLDERQDNLILTASIGYDLEPGSKIPLGEGITGHVAISGVPALQSDTTNDPRHIPGIEGSRSEMAVPLRVFGEVIGVLDAESRDVGAFDEADLDLFASFAAQAAIAIHASYLTTKPGTTKIE